MITYTSFAELYSVDFELTDLFAMRQKWKSGVLFSMLYPRKANGIIYLVGCTGKYTSLDKPPFFADKKSLVLLPRGSRYTVLNIDCVPEGTDAFLIEFNAKVNGEEITFGTTPTLLEGKADFETAVLIEKTVNAYESARRCPSAVKSCIYELIAHISGKQQTAVNDKYESVRKGIKIIEKSVYSDDSIETIASECNVSATHFRRLFKEYAHTSPQQYRTELKIVYAKRMLAESDMSVSDIAEVLGFESDSYFCRVFKKQTGMTPSEYRNSYLCLSEQ